MIAPDLAAQEKAICKLLLKTLRLFYADEQNRKEFEEWYLATWGEPYVWKPYYKFKEK